MLNNKQISVLRFVIQVLRPSIFYVFIQMVVGIIWAFDLAFRPFLIKILLNKTTTINPSDAVSELMPIAIAYTVISFFLLFVFRLHDWAWLKISAPLRQHINLLLMDRMMNQSHHFYQNNFAGAISNKITDISTHVGRLYKIALDAFYSHGMSVIASIIALSRVGYRFGISMFIWIVFFGIISWIFSKHASHLSNVAATKMTSVVGFVVDILSNMISVRLFTGKEYEKGFLNDRLTSFIEADQQAKWFYILINSLQGLSFVVFHAVCTWYLIKGFRDGWITPGDFALVFTITVHVVNNLWSLSRDIRDFSESWGIVMQGMSILRAPVDIKDDVEAKPLVVTEGQIVFEKVQFKYKDALPFFHEKSVVIRAREKVGLVGYSGSGKSTFVNLILRLFEVNSGRILIDNQPIKMVTQESLRNLIAMIPQEPVLLHRSIMENIRYGKRDATDQEVIEAAKKARAHDFIAILKDGYYTVVGERGSKLSGGQRQRLSIARAILKNAPILILDEATSQLDVVTEGLIQTSIDQLMEGKTTIVVAHRLSTLLQMDRLLVFDRGQIVEDGSHEQLLAQGGLYATMWNAQTGGVLPISKKITVL